MNDLLNSECGKHDYDWLLTPPETPRVPNIIEKALVPTISKHGVIRSSSAARVSRLSVSQPEIQQNLRPARSSSVSRPSIQSPLMSGNNRTAALNTSISSVTSRSSTTSKWTSAVAATKYAAPPACSISSRSSTPVKPRSTTPVKSHPISNPVIVKSSSVTTSRPSTPTSRPRVPSTASLSTTTLPMPSRSNSRSSTPTRQPIVLTTGPLIGRSPSAGRKSISSSSSSTNQTSVGSGWNSAPSSRASSPNTRPRVAVVPLDIPDFPNETPPNLRTKLPERAISAGRTRPGMALTMRSSTSYEPLDSAVHASSNRKSSASSVSMMECKFSDVPARVPSSGIGSHPRPAEKLAAGEERKPVISGAEIESGELSRISSSSKKSLGMATRHTEVRQSLGNLRGASLFPHSIRASPSKGRPGRQSDPVDRAARDGRNTEKSSHRNFSADYNGAFPRNAHNTYENWLDQESVASDLDTHGSLRYDMMLLTEDMKNTNWLHSGDGQPDQSPVFDHRFEPLPEPFGPQ